MTDEPEDAVVVVLGLSLAEKNKEKRLWKKSWRRRECELYALQRKLEVSKNCHVTDSFESSVERSGPQYCESPWQQVNKRLTEKHSLAS